MSTMPMIGRLAVVREATAQWLRLKVHELFINYVAHTAENTHQPLIPSLQHNDPARN